MAAKLAYFVKAPNGKFVGNDGQEHTSYITCGKVFRRDDGTFALKLDSVPVGDWNGWFNLFPPEPRGNRGGGESGRRSPPPQQPRPQPQQPQLDDFDDDIPF